jgi:hypothetical protein
MDLVWLEYFPNGSGSLAKNSHWQDSLAYFNLWRTKINCSHFSA